MNLTSITDTPPMSYEAVDAVFALVDASSSVAALFAGSKEIYRNVRAVGYGFQSVTIRERSDLGGRMMPVIKHDDVPIHVVVECGARTPQGAENTEYAKWIAKMHHAIGEAIVGQKPIAAMYLPIRYDVFPTTPVLDVEEDRYRSVALYRVALKEVEA